MESWVWAWVGTLGPSCDGEEGLPIGGKYWAWEAAQSKHADGGPHAFHASHLQAQSQFALPSPFLKSKAHFWSPRPIIVITIIIIIIIIIIMNSIFKILLLLLLLIPLSKSYYYYYYYYYLYYY